MPDEKAREPFAGFFPGGRYWLGACSGAGAAR